MNTNYCPNCGTELSAGENFCAGCGSDVKSTSENPPDSVGQVESIECAKCGTISDTGTQECPNCEYRPQKSMQVVGMLVFTVGVIISLTVVGAIVGVPMAAFGIYRTFKGRDLTIESGYGT